MKTTSECQRNAVDPFRSPSCGYLLRTLHRSHQWDAWWHTQPYGRTAPSAAYLWPEPSSPPNRPGGRPLNTLRRESFDPTCSSSIRHAQTERSCLFDAQFDPIYCHNKYWLTKVRYTQFFHIYRTDLIFHKGHLWISWCTYPVRLFQRRDRAVK